MLGGVDTDYKENDLEEQCENLSLEEGFKYRLLVPVCELCVTVLAM